MSASGSELRVRRSLYELQDEYTAGNTKALDDLMRAWKGIKELPPDDLNSFFVIGGYHGEPFRGGGLTTNQFWGGYCNHGNVLFPTWHRMYLIRLEEALQSIPGCADVMLPFWDETDERTVRDGIPWALTEENYKLDGRPVPNPLRSFTFPRAIKDSVSADKGDDPNNPNYSKHAGYETVRYPLSGLVGTDADRALTKMHNALFPDYRRNVELLNENVTGWLAPTATVNGVKLNVDLAGAYRKCLDAPNYTVFSNTTSSKYWNDALPDQAASIVPLEQPHNWTHLAVGGFSPAGDMRDSNQSPLGGANGDMGENDTAGLDPIFFFHHCFVDRVFWLWQRRHSATRELEVIEDYPGTNTSDMQGPTPGFAPNTWLTLDTPLNPFRRPDGTSYTSRDCIDIEGQLGYTYGPGSLEELVDAVGLLSSPEARTVRISGIDRSGIRGSFVMHAFATINGQREHVGMDAVLSRWNVSGCANCQTHLNVTAFIDMPEDVAARAAEEPPIDVEVHTKDGRFNQFPIPGPQTVQSQSFQVELRQ